MKNKRVSEIGIRVVKGGCTPSKPHVINSKVHKRFIRHIRKLMK